MKKILSLFTWHTVELLVLGITTGISIHSFLKLQKEDSKRDTVFEPVYIVKDDTFPHQSPYLNKILNETAKLSQQTKNILTNIDNKLRKCGCKHPEVQDNNQDEQPIRKKVKPTLNP